MSNSINTGRKKFITEDVNDYLTEFAHQKEEAKGKKNLKRPKSENFDVLFPSTKKPANIVENNHSSSDDGKTYSHKVLSNMNNQQKKRKQGDENLLKSLTEILVQLETDYNNIKDSEQKLEKLTGAVMKCVQQTSTAFKEKIKAVKLIHTAYKQQCDEMEAQQRAENEKLAKELEVDIEKLQEKLTSEARRNAIESMRKSVYDAMQNNF